MAHEALPPEEDLSSHRVDLIVRDPVDVDTRARVSVLGDAGVLLTDIEGSTSLLRSLGDQYTDVLLRHNELLREAVTDHDGMEVGSEGDSMAAVFPSGPHAAVRAAVAAQRALGTEPWPGDRPVRVRMGVHLGAAELIDNSAVGLAIHESARIRNTAHGGQIVLSDDAARAVRIDLAPDVELIDLGRHEVRDLVGRQRLWQVVGPELLTGFPPLRAIVRRPTPRSNTAFVGRVAELYELLDAIDQPGLVTIVGAGGTGKTRLAYEVGDRVDTIDDIMVLELAAIDRGELVAPALSDAVGSEDPATAIGERRALLIVDNCEPVIDAVAAVVAGLVQRCPRLTVLATSRVPLELSGEKVWRTPTLTPTDAGALFTHRAQLAAPGVPLDTAAVEQVCARLDGIPLAIELAAARLRSLPIDDLPGRLDRQMELLTGGPRDRPRHRTMRSTLDWSIEQLDDDEVAVLRRASVFRGGFTPEAAGAVLALPSPVDVDSALDALVTQSLIEFSPAAGRYGLLEPVRQYVGPLLEDADESELVGEAHARWVLRLVRPATLGLVADLRTWTARLDAEGANIDRAITFALDHGLDELALRMVGHLGYYWSSTRRAGTATVVGRAMERLPSIPESLQTWALLGAGIALYDDHRDDRPVGWLREAAARCRRAERAAELGTALYWQGRALTWRGRNDEARACFEEGVRVFEQLDYAYGLGWCRESLALIAATVDGDPDRAEELQLEVLDIARRGQVPHVEAAATAELGALALRAGRREDADLLLHQAVELYRGVGDRRPLASALVRLAVAESEGDLARAGEHLVEAIDTFTDLASEGDLRWALRCAAHLLDRAGQRTEAASALAAAGTAPHRRLELDVVPIPSALLDAPELAGAVTAGRQRDLVTAIRGARRSLVGLTRDLAPAPTSATGRRHTGAPTGDPTSGTLASS
jgi:predicted ATPase/tetratricopeptide (TPR) repeat protein